MGETIFVSVAEKIEALRRERDYYRSLLRGMAEEFRGELPVLAHAIRDVLDAGDKIRRGEV